jgi:hypothetical protein
MWKNDQSLIVTAGNNNGSRLHIKFKILDTDISDRWLDMIKQNQQASNTIQANYRKILNPDERNENFAEFRDNILKINSMYDIVLDDVISLEHLHANQNVLNDLHEEFEIYGDRLQYLLDTRYFNDPDASPELATAIWPGRRQNFDLHDRFLRLNEQIHNFEAVFRNWETPDQGLCTCLVDYLPAGIHQDLKPEDFFLFGSDLQWGWMYLGYNTLGKHWSSVLNENDIEVVKRHAVRPQARFAAEFYMHFGRPSLTYVNRVKFYNWWMKNNLSEVHDPDMKLSELALGYIPMARISDYKIGDGESITIPVTYSHKDAKEWNVNVWSKFNKIINIQILDAG